MPHVSVCDSHNELPQSKHCVLAVLEQGKPSASRTSTTSQLFGMGLVYDLESGMPAGGETGVQSSPRFRSPKKNSRIRHKNNGRLGSRVSPFHLEDTLAEQNRTRSVLTEIVVGIFVAVVAGLIVWKVTTAP